eukprot:SAG11_NODE_3164_length_2641_cov_2.733281_3_plen_99_part_00
MGLTTVFVKSLHKQVAPIMSQVLAATLVMEVSILVRLSDNHSCRFQNVMSLNCVTSGRIVPIVAHMALSTLRSRTRSLFSVTYWLRIVTYDSKVVLYA